MIYHINRGPSIFHTQRRIQTRCVMLVQQPPLQKQSKHQLLFIPIHYGEIVSWFLFLGSRYCFPLEYLSILKSFIFINKPNKYQQPTLSMQQNQIFQMTMLYCLKCSHILFEGQSYCYSASTGLSKTLTSLCLHLKNLHFSSKSKLMHFCIVMPLLFKPLQGIEHNCSQTTVLQQERLFFKEHKIVMSNHCEALW